jgi:hypothetical protein
MPPGFWPPTDAVPHARAGDKRALYATDYSCPGLRRDARQQEMRHRERICAPFVLTGAGRFTRHRRPKSPA